MKFCQKTSVHELNIPIKMATTVFRSIHSSPFLSRSLCCSRYVRFENFILKKLKNQEISFNFFYFHSDSSLHYTLCPIPFSECRVVATSYCVEWKLFFTLKNRMHWEVFSFYWLLLFIGWIWVTYIFRSGSVTSDDITLY